MSGIALRGNRAPALYPAARSSRRLYCGEEVSADWADWL